MLKVAWPRQRKRAIMPAARCMSVALRTLPFAIHALRVCVVHALCRIFHSLTKPSADAARSPRISTSAGEELATSLIQAAARSTTVSSKLPVAALCSCGRERGPNRKRVGNGAETSGRRWRGTRRGMEKRRTGGAAIMRVYTSRASARD